MIKTFTLSLLVISFFLNVGGISAQQVQPSPLPPAQASPAQPQKPSTEETDVVRINTNLVQIDVSVVDKNNVQVTDLQPDDFEIREDDHARQITNLSYVSSASRPDTTAANATAKVVSPVPATVPLTASQVKRTMALVVDDISLSLESLSPVRQALRKFVDEQMQPGDLVAILRTSGGTGILQQFTSDKRQLYAAINDIRWSPTGRAAATAVEPIQSRYATTDEMKELEEFRSESLSVGTFGALSYIIRGLKALPGRKSIVFFSESLRITSAKGRNDRLLNAMQIVAEQANRASVVLYTQDASGLQPMNYSAAYSSMTGSNDISQASMGNMAPIHQTAEAGLAALNALSDRKNVEYETHSVLDFLAQQTGGTFTRFNNDLNASIRSALADQQGYYLIGYRPDESTFDPATGAKKFHKLEIRVKRPGLKVRYRGGFVGVPETARATPSTNPADVLARALVSPFESGGIHVGLTSLFRGDAVNGSSVTSLIHIDGHDLNLKETADGGREGSIDLLAMTFSDNGSIVDQIGHTEVIRIRGDAYQRFLNNGLTYNLSVPIKKAGAYQLRVAVRDGDSSRLGSAGQFIEVPNLSSGHLALSSIVVTASDPNAKPAPEATAGGDDQFEQQMASAVRRLHYGMLLDYGYVIYNAHVDKTNKTQLQTQIRLLRDGQEVFAGRVNPFDPTGQKDVKELTGGGRLQIGTILAPGQYLLEVIVTDQLEKEKFRTVTQWIDFEIVK